MLHLLLDSAFCPRARTEPIFPQKFIRIPKLIRTFVPINNYNSFLYECNTVVKYIILAG